MANDDPTLFDLEHPEDDHGLARHTDPDTSQTAARSIDATTLEAMVLNALRRRPGSTTEEIVELTGLSLVTVSSG